MRKILIINGHPNLQKSLANKNIITILRDKLNADIHNIASKYPNFDFDIQKEQDIILEYDILFFQYPIYWCSMPGFLKEWIDKIFAINFAYGNKHLLKNKKIVQSVTLSGENSAESRFNVLNKMMFPIQGLAKHCKMNYYKEFVLYGMNYTKSKSLDFFINKTYQHTQTIINEL